MSPEPGRPVPPTGADWAGRRVCVTGLGLSGAAAARALLRLGCRVTVVDAADGPAQRGRSVQLRGAGAEVRLGPEHVATPPPGTEVVITSPGWRPDQPLLADARHRGVPVWGEVELAWRLRPAGAAPWLAVTGTNGKTTTVRMLAAILAAAGRRTVAAGNVGLPLIDAVLPADSAAGRPGAGYDVLAVELSSFQLHWARSPRPYAAALLNVADDHRDWHGSFEAYARDKQRIFGDPGSGPPIRVAIGNADDKVGALLLRRAHADRTVSFTTGEPGPGQLGVAAGNLLDRAFSHPGDSDPVDSHPGDGPGGGRVLAAVDDVRPPGPHNVANALAAAALGRAYGVPAVAVRAGLRAFRPDGHRNAEVAVVNGVRYVDDSKATNPHAALASLAGYDSVVWIAGGLLKGADVEPLVRASAGRLRGVVLIGLDPEPFRTALARHAPVLPVAEAAVTETGRVPSAGSTPAPSGVAVMAAAVRAAARLARPGDTVLLAPAAASMDQFEDYATRGDAFAAAVRALPAGDRR